MSKDFVSEWLATAPAELKPLIQQAQNQMSVEKQWGIKDHGKTPTQLTLLGRGSICSGYSSRVWRSRST
jgi:hypothetical protein